MKLRKRAYCIIGIITVSTIILTNSILMSKEEIKKTKVTINYNKKVITEDTEDLNEVRSSISGSNSEDDIIILPVPDTSKQIILNAL